MPTPNCSVEPYNFLDFTHPLFWGKAGSYEIAGIPVTFKDPILKGLGEKSLSAYCFSNTPPKTHSTYKILSFLRSAHHPPLTQKMRSILFQPYLHIFIHEMGHALTSKWLNSPPAVTIFSQEDAKTFDCSGVMTPVHYPVISKNIDIGSESPVSVEKHPSFIGSAPIEPVHQLSLEQASLISAAGPITNVLVSTLLLLALAYFETTSPNSIGFLLQMGCIKNIFEEIIYAISSGRACDHGDFGKIRKNSLLHLIIASSLLLIISSIGLALVPYKSIVITYSFEHIHSMLENKTNSFFYKKTIRSIELSTCDIKKTEKILLFAQKIGQNLREHPLDSLYLINKLEESGLRPWALYYRKKSQTSEIYSTDTIARSLEESSLLEQRILELETSQESLETLCESFQRLSEECFLDNDCSTKEKYIKVILGSYCLIRHCELASSKAALNLSHFSNLTNTSRNKSIQTFTLSILDEILMQKSDASEKINRSYLLIEYLIHDKNGLTFLYYPIKLVETLLSTFLERNTNKNPDFNLIKYAEMLSKKINKAQHLSKKLQWDSPQQKLTTFITVLLLAFLRNTQEAKKMALHLPFSEQEKSWFFQTFLQISNQNIHMSLEGSVLKIHRKSP